MTRLRTSSSPSRGSATSTSTSRKSSGSGQPLGRRASCHSRPVVMRPLSSGLRLDDGTQLAAQDLAGRRYWNLVDAADLAQLLVGHDAFVDERHDLVRVGVL